MAWTNQSFSVGQVLTAAQVNNLNNNVTAIMNGDSGAPRLQQAALRDSVAATGYIVASSLIDARNSGETVFTKYKEIGTPYNGSLSVSFRIVGSFVNPEGRIYVNGTAVGTSRSGDGTYVETISGLVAGDLIQIYTKNTAPGGTTTVSDFTLSESAPLGYSLNLE